MNLDQLRTDLAALEETIAYPEAPISPPEMRRMLDHADALREQIEAIEYGAGDE